MSVPRPHTLTQPLRDRAAAVAHRLLTGAGVASLVAYRIDPDRSIEVLAHGVDSDGTLVVALATDLLPADAVDQDVRMDVRREATEATVRITSASIHLLGRLTLLAPDEVAALREDEQLTGTAALLLAHGPAELRWARVSTERVLLRDATGVTPFARTEVVSERDAFPSPDQEINAHEAVATGTDLQALVRAVVAGALPGRVQSDRPSPPACEHTDDRVFCVDVDGLGVNLMHAGPERTTVVFVPFDAEVTDLGSLRAAVAALGERVGTGSTPRNRSQRGW